MKVIRRLVQRGHSAHVSIPVQVIDYLRWRVGDGIVLEVTSTDSLVVRRATPADLLVAPIPPLNLSLTAPGAK